jgi:hypothetical protein
MTRYVEDERFRIMLGTQVVLYERAGVSVMPRPMSVPSGSNAKAYAPI